MSYYLINYTTGDLLVTNNLVGYNRTEQFLYIVEAGQEVNLRNVWDSFYYHRRRVTR